MNGVNPQPRRERRPGPQMTGSQVKALTANASLTYRPGSDL